MTTMSYKRKANTNLMGPKKTKKTKTRKKTKKSKKTKISPPREFSDWLIALKIAENQNLWTLKTIYSIVDRGPFDVVGFFVDSWRKVFLMEPMKYALNDCVRSLLPGHYLDWLSAWREIGAANMWKYAMSPTTVGTQEIEQVAASGDYRVHERIRRCMLTSMRDLEAGELLMILMSTQIHEQTMLSACRTAISTNFTRRELGKLINTDRYCLKERFMEVAIRHNCELRDIFDDGQEQGVKFLRQVSDLYQAAKVCLTHAVKIPVHANSYLVLSTQLTIPNKNQWRTQIASAEAVLHTIDKSTGCKLSRRETLYMRGCMGVISQPLKIQYFGCEECGYNHTLDLRMAPIISATYYHGRAWLADVQLAIVAEYLL
jgi:hypothetical protein